MDLNLSILLDTPLPPLVPPCLQTSHSLPKLTHPFNLVSKYLTMVYGYCNSMTFMIMNSKSLLKSYFYLFRVQNIFQICSTNLSFYYYDVMEQMDWVEIKGFQQLNGRFRYWIRVRCGGVGLLGLVGAEGLGDISYCYYQCQSIIMVSFFFSFLLVYWVVLTGSYLLLFLPSIVIFF